MNVKSVQKILWLSLGGLVLAAGVGIVTASRINPKEIEIIDSSLISEPSLELGSIETAEISLSSENLNGIGSHVLKIKTNSPDGYTVSIKSKSEETSLTSETTEDEIVATSGTKTDPKVLEDDTWGYTLATDGANPTIGSKFVGITSDATTLYQTESPNFEEETLDVYFATNITKYIEAGTYTNTVVYTVTANTDVDSLSAPTIESVTPNTGAITGGEEITIVGTNYTKNGESITTEVLIGGKACTDVVITADSPEVGKDTITCKIPESESTGLVDVEVKTWGGTATKEDAFKYDNSDIVFVTPNIASVVAGSESGPTFTIYGSGFLNEANPVVDVYIGDGHKCEEYKIIDDTQITCTKGPNDGDTTTGDRRVYALHRSGAKSGGNINVTYSDEAYAVLDSTSSLSSICSATKTTVRDTRDSQLYQIARLADGKCWMMDNLKYSGFGTLAQVANEALSVDKTTASTTGNYEVAKFVDPGVQEYCRGETNVPSSAITRCGLLYNWYAATNATGNDSLTSIGENATDSICPAGMKLPSSIANGNFTYGQEEAYATADFPTLVASLNADAVATGTKPDNSYAWQSGVLPTGTWGGYFSGFWSTKFVNVGSQGYYWSSSVATKADGKIRAHYMSFLSREVRTGDGSYGNDTRNYGFAVRCVEK